MEIEVETASHEEVVTDIVSTSCSTNGDRIGKVNFKPDKRPAKKCWNDLRENGLKNNWPKTHATRL